MKLTDVRRLTGASLILDGPGAAGEAELPAGREGLVVALWRRQMRAILAAVGWGGESVRVRPYEGGASLAVTAPIDGLYAATELIEWAWEATEAILKGGDPPDLDVAAAELRYQIAEERRPRLVALAEAAARHGVTFLAGEERVSLGLGTGCRAWPEEELPDEGDVPWDKLHDVPLALVTGTNGKSTTVRLAAAIGAAAGRAVGLCSSDWVRAAGETIAEGDYSGPGGARRAVRDPRVELAVLEVARGGLMRRGLALPRAEACLITNVAADHLGDYGINDVADLTDAKFTVLVRRSTAFAGEISWFSLNPGTPDMAAWLAAGGEAALLEDGQLVLAKGKARRPVLPVEDFPLGMKGAARFNIANALGAIALAAALGLPAEAMARGLAGFAGGPDANPGRGNFIEVGGITVLVDFAHNTHGVTALMEAIRPLPAKRRLYLLGHAGDRRDDDIRELVRAVWAERPDRIIVKEMEKVLRGRAVGEIPRLIAEELSSLGAPANRVGQAASELESVRQALAWAAPGDLLVLLLHSERKEALALLQELRDGGWQAGAPLEG
jgi:UDP-N-acetylmuramyl tripeptide synthase